MQWQLVSDLRNSYTGLKKNLSLGSQSLRCLTTAKKRMVFMRILVITAIGLFMAENLHSKASNNLHN